MRSLKRASIVLAITVAAPIALASAASATTCPAGTTKYDLKGDGNSTQHYVCVDNNPGPKGDKGDTGATGPAGPKGSTGDTGPAGPSGPAGPAGAPGDAGAPGLPGLPGPQGTPGPQGPAGPKGDTGATGAPGVAGSDGATGPVGPVGPQGPQGGQGQQGTPGPQGPKGDDAFILSSNNAPGCEEGGKTFYFGTIDGNFENNSAVTVCNGEDGENGIDGADGARGLRGPAGTTTIVQADGTKETVDGLPKTGGDETNTWAMAGAAGVLLAVGSGVVIASRRRKGNLA